jgi:protein-tyrosine phosphatase
VSSDPLDGYVPAHLRDDLDDEVPPWPPDEIVPGLWQSGHPEPGEHWDAVFDLSGSEPPLADVEFYVHWRIEDGPAPDLDTLVALADLVRSMRAAGKRVLVHCAAGINRSGLLAAASLIRDGYEPEEAIETVRAARSGALNNPEFVEALRAM